MPPSLGAALDAVLSPEPPRHSLTGYLLTGSSVSGARLAFVGTTHSRAAVAKVGARAAVELVGAGFAIEAIATGATVAAILTRTHVADVLPGPSPASIAAGPVFAEVVAVTADTVAVQLPGDADVIATKAVAAIPFGSLRIAGVRLVVAEQLVGPGPQVGDEGNRQRVEHLHLVVLGPHDHFDRAGPRERTFDGVAAGGFAADLPVVVQVAFDNDVVADHLQPQV